MFPFLRNKEFVRFLVISSILIGGAIASALIAAAAGQNGDYEVASFASKLALGLSAAILVYVVPRLARNVRLEYLQTGLTMNVTSAGWLFCSFILIVAISAVSTGNNLLYMILAALLSMMIVSGISSRLSLGDVSVSLRFPDHIFAGDPVKLDVTLTNQKKIFPSFSLSVSTAESKGKKKKGEKDAEVPGELAHFAILPARAKARATLTRTFAKRGVFPVNGFNIATRFPFGFVERKRFVEASGQLIVYPHPKPVDDFYHLLPLTHGQVESNTKGGGSDLYAIRPYVPSDHPRYVDWKATAKSSRLMVREYTREDDWRATIALDTTGGSETEFEKAIEFAASLITHFLDEGAEVRLIAGNKASSFGHENDHRYAMLRTLAELQYSSEPQTESIENRMPALLDEEFKILVTSAPRGSIPANIWRTAHVVYFDEV